MIADKIQDRDAGQQVSAGTSSPISGWALPTSDLACWTSASEVSCLRQTECATDSHNHQSQELCCFRSRHFEQPTNRPASFVTVDGNFCTTHDGTPVSQHWMTYDSASEFFKAALFISDFIIIIIIIIIIIHNRNDYRNTWLCLPSYSCYSFTDPEGMEGWVDLDGWLHSETVCIWSTDLASLVQLLTEGVPFRCWPLFQLIALFLLSSLQQLQRLPLRFPVDIQHTHIYRKQNKAFSGRTDNEKSARRRRKHCTLAVVRWSQKFSPRCRPPSRRRGTAKI